MKPNQPTAPGTPSNHRKLAAMAAAACGIVFAAAALRAQQAPIKPVLTAPGIAVDPKGILIGMSLDQLSGPSPVKQPATQLTAQAQAIAFKAVLKADVPPEGLGATAHLTPKQPDSPGAAFVSSFGADVNTQYNFYGLNGRSGERLQIGFKSAQAGKPILVTVGIGQALSGGASVTLNFTGAARQTNTIATTTSPTQLNIVVTPGDTNWYKLELTANGVVLINYVDLTPMR